MPKATVFPNLYYCQCVLRQFYYSYENRIVNTCLDVFVPGLVGDIWNREEIAYIRSNSLNLLDTNSGHHQATSHSKPVLITKCCSGFHFHLANGMIGWVIGLRYIRLPIEHRIMSPILSQTHQQ
jgi:hypothetical protein